MKTAKELIEILGGAPAVARMLGIKNPSVYEWKERNRIPDDKLIRLAPSIERLTNSKITRKDLRPGDWSEIWPELARSENK